MFLFLYLFYTILKPVEIVLFFLYLQNHDGGMSPNEGSNSGTYDCGLPLEPLHSLLQWKKMLDKLSPEFTSMEKSQHIS